MRATWSALTDSLRSVHGPLARIKRIQRAGLDGIQLLDGSGCVLLQTFNATTPDEVLQALVGIR